MTDLQAPLIEPDATPVQISAHGSEYAEPGTHMVGREITGKLGQLLDEDVPAPVYRCNPFDRRPCPQTRSFEFTAAGHRVLIICFEDARHLPAYAVHLNGERVTCELTHYGEYGWQLAREVWRAIRDRPPVPDAPVPSPQPAAAGAA
jgi:hypothetical protein